MLRQHWGIENKTHWMLDVAFARMRAANESVRTLRNFLLLKRIALNLLTQDTSLKRGIKGNVPKLLGIILTCSSYWEFNMPSALSLTSFPFTISCASYKLVQHSF